MRKIIAATCLTLAVAAPAFAETPAMHSGMATYYTLQPADLRASKVIGTTVYNNSNENIGDVNDIILSKNNSVEAIVIGVGGFLGVGERNVAVRPESVNLAKQPDGKLKITVNADKTSLQKAPQVDLTVTGSLQ